MKSYLKCGVSAVALLAAVSLAQAQTVQGQGNERGGAATAGHAQGEAGRAGGMTAQGGPAGENRQGSHGARRAENMQKREGGGAAAEGGQTTKEKSAQTRQEMQHESRAQNERGSKEEQQGQRAQNERQGTGERTNKSERSAKAQQRAGQGERGSEQNTSPAEQQHARGSENGQANAGREGQGNARGGRYASLHVTAPQRTRLHDVIVHDSAIRVYHQQDIGVPVRVGVRIPERLELYTPPPQFISIDPAFREYRIVVLEGEILVIDPETREIVDIIQI